MNQRILGLLPLRSNTEHQGGIWQKVILENRRSGENRELNRMLSGSNRSVTQLAPNPNLRPVSTISILTSWTANLSQCWLPAVSSQLFWNACK